MSTEGRLGAAKLRRIREWTGIDAVAGWAWHPVWEFRDAADNHYAVNTRTKQWRLNPDALHYTSCPEVAKRLRNEKA